MSEEIKIFKKAIFRTERYFVFHFRGNQFCVRFKFFVNGGVACLGFFHVVLSWSLMDGNLLHRRTSGVREEVAHFPLLLAVQG